MGITDRDKNEEDRNLETDNKTRVKNAKKQKNGNRTVYTCCDQLPHDRFPGIEHYFNRGNGQSRLSSPRKQPSNRSQKSTHPKESEDDSDDKDVIMPNNEK